MHIAICIINIVIKSYISKFSQVKCPILFLLHCLIYRVRCQKDFEKTPLQGTSKDNSGNIANVVICFYVFKFSKENCFALHFYCTVLCAGRSTKEGLSHLLLREFLRKTQETLQISVFSLILQNLVKNVSYFLSIYCTALCTERIEPPH